MRKLEYRRPRCCASFAVDFLSEGELLRGLCRDLNESGLRAELDGRCIVGASGTLTLRHPGRTLSLQATIAYLDEADTVLTFVFEDARQRGTVSQAISAIISDASSRRAK